MNLAARFGYGSMAVGNYTAYLGAYKGAFPEGESQRFQLVDLMGRRPRDLIAVGRVSSYIQFIIFAYSVG